MKSLKIIFLFSTLLMLSACGQNTAGTPEKDADAKEEGMPQVEDLGIGEIDATKQAVELRRIIFPTEMTQGDDGNCYYLRKKSKNKIVFYCNDGKEVVETKFKGDLESIRRFVKYKNHIYVLIYKGGDDQLAFIDTKTGEWKYLFKLKDDNDLQIFFYEDSIYCRENNYSDVIHYNLKGEKMGTIPWKMELLNGMLNFDEERHIQMIVDGKIYYTVSTLTAKEVKKNGVNYIYSCNLDGTEEKKLVEYQRLGPVTDKKKRAFFMNEMTMDDKYIYMREFYEEGDSGLYRIPMRGGEMEKVTDRRLSYYKLNDGSIYFEDDGLYKMSQDLTEETKIFDGEPISNFFFAGEYLMLEGYDEKEWDDIYDAWDDDIDVSRDYTSDYYLVTLDGEIVSKLEGTDVKYTGHHPGEEKWFE